MSVLSDHIELFIKELMGAEEEISLQRNELAQYFACAPSQINYVLSTRFSPERGYIIVSRRGGGGYIRLLRVDMEKTQLLHGSLCGIGDAVSEREATNMIKRLQEAELLSGREASLLHAAASNISLPVQDLQDHLRARILKGMLSALLRHDEEE